MTSHIFSTVLPFRIKLVKIVNYFKHNRLNIDVLNSDDIIISIMATLNVIKTYAFTL